MTSAALPVTLPTAVERGALRMATRITRLVERRIARREQRRLCAFDALREQRTRCQEPVRYERVLQDLGTRML